MLPDASRVIGSGKKRCENSFISIGSVMRSIFNMMIHLVGITRKLIISNCFAKSFKCLRFFAADINRL